MEWVANKASGRSSVVVPDEIVPQLLEALHPTAVPIDPYADVTIAPESLASVTGALRRIVGKRRRDLEREVLSRLRLENMTPWAKRAVDTAEERDVFLRVAEQLTVLCEEAGDDGCAVIVLGQ